MAPKTTTSNNKIYLDYLTCLSALAVVFLHTNGVYWQFSRERYWISANVIESIFFFAVPIFFMISGATLLDYRQRYRTKQYFLKRLKRVGFPFIFWSALAGIYCDRFDFFLQFDLSQVVQAIFKTQYFSIYWFFIPLFALYSVIPLFSAIDSTYRKSVYQGLIIAFISMALLGSYFSPLKHFLSFDLNQAFPFQLAYVGYALLGYYLDRYEMSQRGRSFLYVAGLLGLMIHLFGTWYYSYQADAVSYQVKSYLSVNTIAYASAIFVWFKVHLDKRHIWLTCAVKHIKPLTFGVYLVHYYLVIISSKVFNPYSIFYRTIGAVLIFMGTLLIIWLIRLSKFGRKVT